ncbi:branched-chain amino acid aminotransferase [Algoriphagus boseongensis]|uniref:branched-chain-amino-acid transaminase n=1 Tax=Algoriphagus boseongensis TaxID=1442587 RepID=A0A4R6T3Q7_9BACT|nr:aminotransferase class IV [Algoriphagus boseongensis]TDQ15141.1 branched-chain amino acid aminotransferase [Algoriphagus boseongensis]
MKPFCFADGTIIPSESATIHPMDLGLIRGYGIFDFFRTSNYQPLFIEHYLDRFIASAEKTHLPLKYSREELKAIISELTEKNDLKQGGFRMVLSGGVSQNHFSPAEGKLFIFCESLDFPAEEKYNQGIKLLTLEYVRPIAEIKTTNYALPVWHSYHWKNLGAEDVLYHWNGMVSESSRSNFFIVKNGIIHTPDQHILLGITRKHILQLAKDAVIRPITLEEVWDADEAFITSTTKVLLPVTQLDDRKIGNGKVGPVTRSILERFRNLEKELVG